MIQGLKWVKENIAQFGGDPDNVMIFGQSAGGGAVRTLVESPLARGLFNKAVIMSAGGMGGMGGGRGARPAAAPANARPAAAPAFAAPTLESIQNANKAILAMKSGDIAAAEQYMGKASGADSYQEVQGAFSLAKGYYVQADKNLSGVNTNSAALAQIMNKNYAAAKNTLANVKDQSAVTGYLKAVLGARTNNSAAIANGLKEASSAVSGTR